VNIGDIYKNAQQAPCLRLRAPPAPKGVPAPSALARAGPNTNLSRALGAHHQPAHATVTATTTVTTAATTAAMTVTTAAMTRMLLSYKIRSLLSTMAGGEKSHDKSTINLVSNIQQTF
jgi:hypothetical protein